MMNRSLITRCAVCLCFFMVDASAAVLSVDAAVKEDSGKKQIQRIESKLNEESSKLTVFQSKEAHLLTLVAELEKQVAETNKETEALATNIVTVREGLDAQKEKLKELKSILMKTELQISEYLIALYKYSRRGNARILTNAKALSELQRNIKYIGIITEKDRSELRELTDRASVFHDESAKTEASISETERLLKDKSSRLALIKKSLDEKVLLLMKVHEEKEFYETSVEELETAVADLKNAIDPVKREDPYAMDPSLQFEACKGILPWPIEGKMVENREHIGGAFSNAKGVVIQADADSVVKAVFRGEVAYSGRLKGYGEVVILDHGERFFTVSANLAKREKATGDHVHGGDVLGWVGGNGTSRSASVYFEVRKADKKLNPEDWLKAE